MTDGMIDLTTAAAGAGTGTSSPANAADARTALAGLRPQSFGDGRPERVADPLVEPLWAGIRALAAIDIDKATLADEAGAAIDGHTDIAAALAEAALAERLIMDGYLTKMTVRDGSGIYVAMDDLPTAGQMMSRPLVGMRRNRAEEAIKTMEADRLARTFEPDDTVSFVAVDLLWLDGEGLFDVPLLERRRLLESVLAESDLVRRGVFVRPPLDSWIGSWRALGFTGLAFKGANSRYRPGVASDDWASAPMPRR